MSRNDLADDILNKALNFLAKTRFQRLPVVLKLLTLPFWLLIGIIGVMLEP